MTIDELLEKAQQALTDMGEQDFRDLDAIDTWANAAQAYSTTAHAMMLAQMTHAHTVDRDDMPDITAGTVVRFWR